MQDLKSIKRKKVLLKIDLGAPNYYGYSLKYVLKTLKILIENQNGVCIVPTFGPGFLKPGLSSRPFIKFFEQHLKQTVYWLPLVEDAKIQKGMVYLLENTLLDPRELVCDEGYVELFKARFDVMVLDSIINIDANYATTQGLLRSGIPYVFGCSLIQLMELRDLLWRSKVGLVLGGDSVAIQLCFITKMIRQIRFIAVGGEVGLLMMGKGRTIFAHIKKALMSTMALLRQYKVQMLYPMDVITYSTDTQRNRLALYQDLEDNELVFDLGRHSVERILSQIGESDLDVVILSGAMGNVLDPRYSRGTESLIKGLTKQKVTRVIIGKTAVMAANRLGLADQYDYILEGDTTNIRFLVRTQPLKDYIDEMVLNVGAVPEGVV